MTFIFRLPSLTFRLISLAIFIIASTFLSGCASNSEKLFPDDYKPKIAIITSVPDEIYINYIGPSVFQNRVSALATDSDLNSFITSELITIFKEENIADVVYIDKEDLTSLEQTLGSSLDKYWHTRLPGAFLNKISEWGKNRKMEYVLLVNPGSWMGYKSHLESSKGIGIHIADDITTHHSVYDFRLIDIMNASVHRHELVATLQRVPVYRHHLSEQEKISALRRWETRKQRSYQFTDDIYTPDMYLDFSTRYDGDDFLKLSPKQIAEIYNQMIPLIKEEIRQSLINMGLLTGRTSGMEHIVTKLKGSEPFN